MNDLTVRKPDIPLEESSLLWSDTHEFALFYNAGSVVIPIVEFYLNKVIADVRRGLDPAQEALSEELRLFILQEAQHAHLHVRFNDHMFAAGFEDLKPVVDDISHHLEKMRTSKSLAFNAAFCGGFETLATFGTQFFYLKCDKHLERAESPAANLLFWHLAEEFEHRAAAHKGFKAVSGSYLMRLAGLFYAFYYIPRSFRRCEKICLRVYWRRLTRWQKFNSWCRSQGLFLRQLVYMIPKLFRIMHPAYDPAMLQTPGRIAAALEYYKTTEPIHGKFDLVSIPAGQ